MARKKQGLNLVVADDHPITLAGLCKMLENRDISIVASASDGTEAFERITEHKPDIAIVDLFMPGLSGIGILKGLGEKKVGTKVIILSAMIEKEYLDSALKLGAKGYLLKENSREELFNAIKFVSEGGIYISPAVNNKLLRSSGPKGPNEGDPRICELSETEGKILTMISENMSSKEIALKLHISFRTVQNHRSNMCTKLGLRGVNSLLLFALKNRATLKP